MTLRSLLATAIIALAHPVHAGGIPVIDTAQITNAREQFAQEIAQMVQELEEARRLYDSINGVTEMADIAEALNDPDVRELLGPQAMEIASLLEVDIDDLGNLSDTANTYLDHTRPTSADISAEDFYRRELDRIGAQSARDAAFGDRIVQAADDRLAGLEQLRRAIGQASTQREIDALSARLQVESAMLQNDTNRIQGLAMLQSAQARVEDQRQTETLLLNSERNLEITREHFGQ